MEVIKYENLDAKTIKKGSETTRRPLIMMNKTPEFNELDIEDMANRIRDCLFSLENESNKNKMQRYFRTGDYSGLGISNSVVYKTVNNIQKGDDRYLNEKNALSVAENLLLHAKFSEERLAAFSLLIKVAKRLKKDFLSRAKYWLEHYVTTWAECDVLCLKTIYGFLFYHIDLIPKLTQWSHSKTNWCRRASNVIMIKFYKKTLIHSNDKKIP